MANVFMLVNYTPADASTGITKKIRAQIQALRRMGHSVTYTAYVDGGVAVFDNQDVQVAMGRHPIGNRKYVALTRYSLLLKTAQKYVQSGKQQFAYCYGRISAPNGRYLKFLQTLKNQGAKIVIEALSYFPGVRPKALKSKYIAFYLNKNKKKLACVIDKFVTEGEVPDFFGIPTEKGKIGVDTEALRKHTYLGSDEELNLITVATEREYHGYDRLVKSYLAYKASGGKAKLRIHLVGELYDSTKKLIEESNCQENVIAHGRVSGDPLFEIYNQCNLGIGPLGQHRIGGKKDTGLKTKEYFGIGLPYIYSGVEEDVPGDYPYIFQVPSDESMIDFDAVWKFWVSIRTDAQRADNMRTFAREVFSWDSIMTQALQL